MNIAQEGAGERSKGGSSRWRVLLLETNADHAELISEALEESLPEIEVLLPAENAGPEMGRLDLVIAGESVSAELIRRVCRGDRRLPVLRISDDQWEGEAAGPWGGDSTPARLSKKEGLPFLLRLSQAVEGILREPSDTKSEREAPVEGSFLERSHLLDSLTSGLIRELSDVAAPLAPWVDQAVKSSGSGLDMALALPGLRQRLARLLALLQRLEAIRRGRSALPRSVTAVLDDWMGLRLPAWGSAADGTGSVVMVPRRGASSVRIVPSLLGPVLDGLVERGIEQCVCGGSVTLETREASFPEGEEMLRRGLPPGRYERLSVRVDNSRGGSTRPLPRLLVEMATAAAKAGGGFFYADSRGAGEFLFPVGSSGAPAPQVDDSDLSVLIVESDPAIRQEASEAIDAAGGRVVEVSDQRRAIALYQAGCRYRLMIAGSESGADRDDPLFSASQLFDPAPLVIAGYSQGESRARLRRWLDQGVLGLIPWPCPEPDLIAAARIALGPSGA